jgi:hypothetical protein
MTTNEPKFTPGPWGWFGNTKCHEIHLATVNRGRICVMDFDRYGMAQGQPRFQVDHRMVKGSTLVRYEKDYRKDISGIDHPDAHLIAASPELYVALEKLAERAKQIGCSCSLTEITSGHLVDCYRRDLDELLNAADVAMEKARGQR